MLHMNEVVIYREEGTCYWFKMRIRSLHHILTCISRKMEKLNKGTLYIQHAAFILTAVVFPFLPWSALYDLK